MVYAALLRGVNVGGRNAIDMKRLKETFRNAGMPGAVTYINSGNVIFRDSTHTEAELTGIIEHAIRGDFGLDIPVLVRDMGVLERMAAILPDDWKDDRHTKCNAVFIREPISGDALPTGFLIRPGVDTVLFTPEVVLWRAERKYSARSGLLEIISSSIYSKITIRNVNTARKIRELMKTMDKAHQDTPA